MRATARPKPLVPVLQLLSEYTPEELTQLAASALGQFRDV